MNQAIRKTVPGANPGARTDLGASPGVRTGLGASPGVKTVPGANPWVKTVPGANPWVKTGLGVSHGITTVTGAVSQTVKTYDAEVARHAYNFSARKKKRFRAIALSLAVLLAVVGGDPLQAHLAERLSLSKHMDMITEISSTLVPRSAPGTEDIGFYSGREYTEPYDIETIPGDKPPIFDINSLKSSAALLTNLDTGNVILGKNQKLRVYPASLTKIMTALIAIEYESILPGKITLDKSIFPPLYKGNSTMSGFLPGEDVPVKDLIYGAMLQSGGECCVALAVAIAGSEEEFVALMNRKAEELFMYDTHFTNSTGLHNYDHYSTVRDLSKLLLFALNNIEFREVFTSKEYMTSPTNLRSEARRFENSAYERAENFTVDVELLGAKTGYTLEAGQCLASMAIKKGVSYIFVSTGNDVSGQGSSYNIEDAMNVYESVYSFEF
ncbi:hypothetical protein FACS1894127_4180 [Clostridia bacterium]|nr:hypothetical protein FACS1894127_4180 [Clostridia bacterium]